METTYPRNVQGTFIYTMNKTYLLNITNWFNISQGNSCNFYNENSKHLLLNCPVFIPLWQTTLTTFINLLSQLVDTDGLLGTEEATHSNGTSPLATHF